MIRGLWGLGDHRHSETGMSGDSFLAAGTGIPPILAVASQQPDGQILKGCTNPRCWRVTNAAAIFVVGEITNVVGAALDGPMAPA